LLGISSTRQLSESFCICCVTKPISDWSTDGLHIIETIRAQSDSMIASGRSTEWPNEDPQLRLALLLPMRFHIVALGTSLPRIQQLLLSLAIAPTPTSPSAKIGCFPWLFSHTIILGTGCPSALDAPDGGPPTPAQRSPLKKTGSSGGRCDLIHLSELASSIIHRARRWARCSGGGVGYAAAEATASTSRTTAHLHSPTPR
jgi:hypothetical protein